MTDAPPRSPRLPPRFVVRSAWVLHRAMLTGGRRGLWPPKEGKWGTLRLTTVGRRTGERHAILGYYEDGPNLVDGYATRRSGETAVVVLEPRSE